MDTINSWHNGCGRPVIVKEEISKIASECMEACT